VERAHLVVSFIGQLHRRLLRAGTTTTHILDVYISVIRAFQELDSKGVLLDRVAQPIRRYLRDRSDTAGIIVSSLLADADEASKTMKDMANPESEISLEIAKEMINPFAVGSEYDADIDWNNMNWTPDPADAGPGRLINNFLNYARTYF
jgi:anaphase-promoting complex subunit 2